MHAARPLECSLGLVPGIQLREVHARQERQIPHPHVGITNDGAQQRQVVFVQPCDGRRIEKVRRKPWVR